MVLKSKEERGGIVVICTDCKKVRAPEDNYKCPCGSEKYDLCREHDYTPEYTPDYDSGVKYKSVGRKDDKGKIRYSLMIEGMPKALAKIVEVLEHGAIKYDVHNWQEVDNGIERYKEAFYRHVMNMDGGLFSKDKDSGLLHLAHIACNALFLMELMELMEDNKPETYTMKLSAYKPCKNGCNTNKYKVFSGIFICEVCHNPLEEVGE